MNRPDDGKVEVRGVIAMNGYGELCFFASSMAEGLPICKPDGGPHDHASVGEDELAYLLRAIINAPPRRCTHAQLAELDPPPFR
jgi:hypothetical protein